MKFFQRRRKADQLELSLQEFDDALARNSRARTDFSSHVLEGRANYARSQRGSGKCVACGHPRHIGVCGALQGFGMRAGYCFCDGTRRRGF